MTDEQEDYSSKFAQTRRGNIHYLEFQQEGAPTICILPGFTMPAQLYVSMGKSLHSYNFSVIIVDYWGRGETMSPSDGNFALSSQISLVSTLLEHLQISKCHIIGISYGAAVASGLVSRSPDLVDKMAFISPLHFTDDSPSPLQKFVLGTSYIGPMILNWAAPSIIPDQIKAQFVHPEKHPEIVKEATRICLEQFKKNKSHAYAISKSISQFDNSDIEQVFAGLSTVNKKMLVFIGIDDRLINLTECKSWWTRWIQNAVICDCDDLGHLMYLEKERMVTKRLAKFF
ncbi:Clan SC, family S33, methylesterase-like serine peptidase [Tritrichomonas foetus]|uniref:Clan SC, family S33, methylesterase-like serine peptidase n=1 Tax=Tritrichomonas foetus TaxID=1144522 RepID=A0A1J4KM25_9EUKA|nr:Clan SC, family S33, methylesterase-like serine peptidase [Tritrichomonas foetus]|eukprot:OHT12367.1 Clan SC, family S33, methylesterase-like serine peptidase [Tritrichomonas foetus]